MLQLYSNRTKYIFSDAAIQQQDQAHIQCCSCTATDQAHIQCYSCTATGPSTYSVMLLLYNNRTKHIFNAAAVQQQNQRHTQCYSYTATGPSTYSVMLLYNNRTKHIFSAAAVQQKDQTHIQCYSCTVTGPSTYWSCCCTAASLNMCLLLLLYSCITEYVLGPVAVQLQP